MRILILAAVTSAGSVLNGCSPTPGDIVLLEGHTMGTTYQAQYPSRGSSGEETQSTHQAIDALLEDINQSLSTYIETSRVSEINAAADTSTWHSMDRHLEVVFDRSLAIYEETNGAFNPAVGPLVNLWGFGPQPHDTSPAETEIQAILPVVDFDGFIKRVSPPGVRKTMAAAALDFSGIAKGYAVDAIGELLEARGRSSYFIEIGGEVRTRGEHPEGRPWRVGIERPTEGLTDPRSSQLVLSLNDAALATSGSYRNYYVQDETRYAHILNPATGYPEASSLLSVSVLAEDCMTADAYATAFMVMGLDLAMDLVHTHPGVEAYFISSDPDGGYLEAQSSGFPAGTSP